MKWLLNVSRNKTFGLTLDISMRVVPTSWLIFFDVVIKRGQLIPKDFGKYPAVTSDASCHERVIFNNPPRTCVVCSLKSFMRSAFIHKRSHTPASSSSPACVRAALAYSVPRRLGLSWWAWTRRRKPYLRTVHHRQQGAILGQRLELLPMRESNLCSRQSHGQGVMTSELLKLRMCRDQITNIICK